MTHGQWCPCKRAVIHGARSAHTQQAIRQQPRRSTTATLLAFAPKRPKGSYDFEPGEEMQHDTSPHDVVIGGVRRPSAE